MALGFNADEVLRMAERIEQNGARFYRKAAESCGAAELNGCLLKLAEMEEAHAKTFADMHVELTGAEAKPLSFDPEGETEKYLLAMADANVFDPDVDLGDAACEMSDEEILDVAIDLEKESIVFYLGLKELVSSQAGKDKVEEILKEEISHIALLRDRLETLA